VTIIQYLLHLYEKASGQRVIIDKTGVFFSINTPFSIQDRLALLLGVPSNQNIEKYLGLPSMVGHSKYKAFADLKAKVEKRVSGWKESFLSQGGREVLIKAVA
jgi:hypothetical protein